LEAIDPPVELRVCEDGLDHPLAFSVEPAAVIGLENAAHERTSPQMETVINRGIQVLIPPDALKRKGARPGWDCGPYVGDVRTGRAGKGGADRDRRHEGPGERLDGIQEC